MYRIFVEGHEITTTPVELTAETIRKYNAAGIVAKKEEEKR